MIKNPELAENMPLSTSYLWFMSNLIAFYFILILFHKIKLYQSPWVSVFFKYSVFSIVLLPTLLLPAALSIPIPWLMPADQVPIPLWAFGLYGLFFLYGYLLYNREHVLEQIEKLRYPLLLLCLTAYGYLSKQWANYFDFADLDQLFPTFSNSNHAITFTFVVDAWLMNFVAVNFSLLALAFGKRLLNSQNRLMRYLSDASYWMYIIHLPIIFLVQYVLIDRPWPATFEFFITISVTTLVSLVSYQYLVRRRFIGRLLNGK